MLWPVWLMASTADQYVKAQNGAVKLAIRDLRLMWTRLKLRDGVAVRKTMEDIWPELLSRYGEVTATLAADRFESLMGLPATMVRSVDPGRANARMRWAIDPLFTGEGDALARMVGLTDELVKQPGRSTMIRSATSQKVRFARVPTGSDTCTWCLMLASRGAVYVSAATARRSGLVAGKFHAECNCTVEPVKTDDDLARLGADGYDPAALFTRWQDSLAAEEAAREMAKASK